MKERVMPRPKTTKRRSWTPLQPIIPTSDLGRWIAAHDGFKLTLEQALADFAAYLRLGRN
jgi:hypothetical protein